jgi:predicted DNA-binding transcriptional regulator AlpA
MNPRPRQSSPAGEQLFLDAGPRAQRARRATDHPVGMAPPAPAADRVDLSQPLVDADVLAGMLCVKRKRIYELARRPDDPLPSVRIGRAVRFVRARVEEWVAHQTLQ